MRILTSIIFMILLSVSTAFACVTSIIQETDRVGICTSGVCAEIMFSTLETNSHMHQEVEIQEGLQKFLDFDIVIASMERDDPDRYIDPDLPGFFWATAEGEKANSIVDAVIIKGRACLVTDVQWDEASQTFSISIAVVN